MSSDLRESTAAAIYNADPRHVRRFEDGGIAYEVRQKYLLQADAALATLLEHGQPIKAYRCPRCGEFSDRDIHCYVKGPPLFPQMDDYTICERVEGVFVESSP